LTPADVAVRLSVRYLTAPVDAMPEGAIMAV
jgi:hypothetical protein